MSKIFKIEYRYSVPKTEVVDHNYDEIFNSLNNFFEDRRITLTYESIVSRIFKYIKEIDEIEQGEGNLDLLYSNMIDTLFYHSTLNEIPYVKYLRLEFGEKSETIENFFKLVNKKYNEYLKDYNQEMVVFINVYSHLVKENMIEMQQNGEGYYVKNFKGIISLGNSDRLTKQNISSKSLRLYVNKEVAHPLLALINQSMEISSRDYVYFTRIHPDYLDYIYADLKYTTSMMDKYNITFTAKKLLEYLDVANFDYTPEEKEEYNYFVEKINNQIDENTETFGTFFKENDLENLASTRELVKTIEKNISNSFDKFINSLYHRVVDANNKALFKSIHAIFINGGNTDILLEEFKNLLTENDLKAYAVFADNIIDTISKNIFISKFVDYFNSTNYREFTKKINENTGYERGRE